MKKNSHIILLCLILVSTPLFSQNQSDTLGINTAANGYIGGWYEGDADKMSNALHFRLAKRQEDYSMTASELIGFTKNCTGCSTPVDQRTIDVSITDISDSIASASVISYGYIDYIDLAKNKGTWRIVNVLWEMKDNKGKGTNDDLLKAVQTYTESWLSGDKDKMASVLANHVYSRISLTDSLVENVVRTWILNEVSSCRECDKNYNYQIKLLDQFNNKNASVKVCNGDSVQYLQVCCYSGVWKIVNILRNFKYNPKPVTGLNRSPEVSETVFSNYPNPFSSTTTIKYMLKTKSNVKIVVNDLTGREMISLVNEAQNPGYHEIVLDGKNLKAGIYICNIITGGQPGILKMRLIK